jgi:hypothetical protein
MAVIPAWSAGGTAPAGAVAGRFGLGCWLAFGVVFDVVLLGEPFCVVFDTVFSPGAKLIAN